MKFTHFTLQMSQILSRVKHALHILCKHVNMTKIMKAMIRIYYIHKYVQ